MRDYLAKQYSFESVPWCEPMPITDDTEKQLDDISLGIRLLPQCHGRFKV